jgi:hypothetical protein
MNQPDRFITVYSKLTELQIARYQLKLEEFQKLKDLLLLPKGDICLDCYPIHDKMILQSLTSINFRESDFELVDYFLESEKSSP